MNFLVARKSVMIMCARVCVHFGERGGTEGGRKREGWETEREGESMRIRECLLGEGGGGGGRVCRLENSSQFHCKFRRVSSIS